MVKRFSTLYKEAYGEPPKLKWFTTKSRQATVERRIVGLVDRKKPFYITIDDNEEWFVDGGNWCHITNDNRTIGHIKNILPFFRGANPIEWGSWNIPDEEKPKTKNPFKRRKK
jgi:hypothetical protein